MRRAEVDTLDASSTWWVPAVRAPVDLARWLPGLA